MLRFTALVCLSLLLCGCGAAPEQPAMLTVAAASNLIGVFDEIGRKFTERTGVPVVLTYGSTTELSKQIENGAPYDVFAAADSEHIASLADAGHIIASSTAVYARGQLAVWAPKATVRDLKDLTKPEIRFIAIAEPALAPYGKAAIDSLKAAGLWDTVQPKVVYGTNINMARQFVATGNADAGFTAYSLVLKESGSVLRVDPKLHAPIDQAIGVLRSSHQPERSREFVKFLASPEIRALLTSSGYETR